MKNFEWIKSVMCDTINAMSEETLFEFMSEYEGDDAYFPKGTIFTCKDCQKLYGDCEAHITSTVNYETCRKRFFDFCKIERE